MIFRAVDIETIPDMSAWTPGEDQYRLIPGFMQKLPSCSTDSIGTLVEHPLQACVEKIEPFPPPQAHRVVAIAFVDIVMDIDKPPRYRCADGFSECRWSLGLDDEKCARAVESSLLKTFSGSMEVSGGGNISLVTWNGRGFDLPVLSMRSLKLGIPFGWYYADRDMRYRYSENGHLDLMDFLGDYGAVRSMKLDDAAHLVGLPGKAAGGLTGASVHDIYKSSLTYPELAREKMISVGRYCLQDAIQTALIFLRTRFHVGRIDREEFNRCLETFAESEFIKTAITIDWDKARL